jgi:hypothetical protein
MTTAMLAMCRSVAVAQNALTERLIKVIRLWIGPPYDS